MLTILRLLHRLIDRPQCDMDVCLNPKHRRLHIQSGTGRAYVPMNLVIESRLKALKNLKGSHS